MEVRIRDLTPLPSAAQGVATAQQMLQRQQRQQTLIDSRRALVLEAARSVFIEMGTDGASMREIAKRAGYTPGALYSYFESKEAMYAGLLEESLERLNAAVDSAREPRATAQVLVAIKARAWFNFYMQNPRDLDLGFYLVQGLAPRGLSGGLDSSLSLQLSARLHDALRPGEEAIQALGLSAVAALRENTALFAHGMGILLLQRAGPMGMRGQSPLALFQDYVDQMLARLHPGAQEQAVSSGQADMFGH